MKLKDKLIIHNYTDLEDYEATKYVLAVIAEGKVSDEGRVYSYVTTFKSKITIFCTRKNNTYTFKIIREE